MGLLKEEEAARLPKETKMQDKTNSRRDFLGLGAELAGVAAFGNLAARLRAAQAVDNVFPGTATNWRARFWRVSCVLLLVVLLAVLLAARADAEPRIKVHCKVYDTNRVDPIAFSEHLHHQIGNTSTTNGSTGDSFFNHKETSCDREWFTSAGWFPVERDEPVRAVNIYYRAPGDQTKVKAIPKGLQLLGTREMYQCGGDGVFQDTPPYDCETNFGTRIIFPDCWNKQSLEETSMVYGSASGECPSSHPYRIPRMNFLVMHSNADGVLPNPLMISAGVDDWHDYTFMHADYFAANQRVFNRKLIDLCLRKASDSETVADPRCGEAS
jgi:hypothetical protein